MWRAGIGLRPLYIIFALYHIPPIASHTPMASILMVKQFIKLHSSNWIGCQNYIYRYPTFEFGGILYILTWTAWDRDDVNRCLLLFFCSCRFFYWGWNIHLYIGLGSSTTNVIVDREVLAFPLAPDFTNLSQPLKANTISPVAVHRFKVRSEWKTLFKRFAIQHGKQPVGKRRDNWNLSTGYKWKLLRT